MGTTLCIPCCGRLLLVHSLCHIFLPVLIFCIYRISPAEFSVLSNVGGANVSKLLAFLKRSISDSKPSIRPSVCTIFGWKFCLQFPVAYSTHWFVFWFWTFQIEGNRFLVLFLLLGWIWKTQICPLQTCRLQLQTFQCLSSFWFQVLHFSDTKIIVLEALQLQEISGRLWLRRVSRCLSIFSFH